MGTFSKVLQAWQSESSKKVKKTREGYYKGNCPWKHGADSESFFLYPSVPFDEEHGSWKYFAGGESGSLYDLATRMGIPLPERKEAKDTKIAYRNLAHYAELHYVDVSVFEKAGWIDSEHKGIKCLEYPVYQIIPKDPNDPASEEKVKEWRRYRMIQEGHHEKRVYLSQYGYSAVWYGLKRAIAIAKQHGDHVPLILCNGEASTVVAQHFGLPAFCCAGGEGSMNDTLIAQLEELWQGKVFIAFDCDKAGRTASERIKGLLKNSHIVDLGLSNKGDLCDFAGLYGEKALGEFMKFTGDVAELRPEPAREDEEEPARLVHLD